MSNAQFAEAHSADPFVKELHRRAVRVLNDQSLDRERRIGLIRQLQQSLLAHQASETNKATRVAARAKSKGRRLFGENGEPVAAPSQVMVRRRELGKQQAQKEMESVEPKRSPKAIVKSIDSPGRRSTLTLVRV